MDREINYGALIDKAMHYIVKEALQIVTESGLPGNHHFFISFLTHYPGVVLSERLRKKYPEEMTIVLQYQFEELAVTENAFSVILSFDNIKERIVVPFMALSAFADPSVKFGLQFRHLQMPESEGHFEDEESADVSTFEADLAQQKKEAEKKNPAASAKAPTQEMLPKSTSSQEDDTDEGEGKNKDGYTNVVQLDRFRNNKNNDKKS